MQLCYSICHQLNLPPAEFSSFPLVEGVQLLTREGAARIVVLVRFHEHEMPHTCHQLNLSPVEFVTMTSNDQRIASGGGELLVYFVPLAVVRGHIRVVASGFLGTRRGIRAFP